MPKKTQFSISALLMAVVLVAILLAWYFDRMRLQSQNNAKIQALKAIHSYTFNVKGTPGIQLSMTLVTKPRSKKIETITVPFSMSLNANEVAAWFEYLPQGQSGNDGDKFEIEVTKDGVTSVYENEIRKSSPSSYSTGDQIIGVGDF